MRGNSLLLLAVFALGLSMCVYTVIEENACEHRGGVLVRTAFGMKCVKELPR